MQTEFAFDVDEIAHHRVAPLKYLRHIGLRVPVRQLALAYYQTYGLTEDFSTFHHGRRFNVGAYNFATRNLLPHAAYALTILHRKGEPAEQVSPERLAMDKDVDAMRTANNWSAYQGRFRHRDLHPGCAHFHHPQVWRSEDGFDQGPHRGH